MDGHVVEEVPMSNSPNLSLPYIQPSQAQKHITHNLAIERLDALVHLSLTELYASEPPAAPFDGQVVGVAAGATGAFAGEDGKLAYRTNGAWMFVPPRNGFKAWVESRGSFYVFQEGDWRVLLAVGIHELEGLGLNTGWDQVNRLAVASAATLLSHEGAGHQLKINKADPADTASLLLQSGFSGRAEIGLAGSDDLAVKVSADGETWSTALSVDGATGDTRLGRVRAASIGGEAVQSAPDDTTPGRLMRADWGYGPGNVVGTVAQTGGVPSGAVIEHGWNEHGRYTRWADGTQICEAETEVLLTDGAIGACYRSTHADITWAAAFADVPAVSGSCSYVGGPPAIWVSTTSPSATKCMVWLMSATAYSQGQVRLLAYGRWI